MTHLSVIAANPKLNVRGGDFLLELKLLSKITADHVVFKMTCFDQRVFSINCLRLPDNDEQQVLVIPIQSVAIPELSKALLILGEEELDVTTLFLHYQLDREKLKDNVYLTNNLFNASARQYSKDDLFIVAYGYLSYLPIDNLNFGGLITLLSYRIGDKLAERSELLDDVYSRYRQLLENISPHNAVAFRWLVSCSSALTTILLAAGYIPQAQYVVNNALKIIVNPGFNPMVHQNYALLLFQSGLIKAWHEQFDEATSLFISAVNAGRYGMIDLLHPQNNWMLGQLSDCQKFLHIIEASYLASLACSRNKLPPESRFAAVKSPATLQINFKLLFERFECCKHSLPPFFEQVLQKMQAHQS